MDDLVVQPGLREDGVVRAAGYCQVVDVEQDSVSRVAEEGSVEVVYVGDVRPRQDKATGRLDRADKTGQWLGKCGGSRRALGRCRSL